jgi:hypothetical protein
MYGIFRMSTFEKVLIVLALFSMLLWYITNTPLYAVCINIFIDSIGMVSIAYKLYRFPETEDSLAWIVSSMMYFFDMLSVTHWDIQNALFICINFLECSIIAILTFKRQTILQYIKISLAKIFHIHI